MNDKQAAGNKRILAITEFKEMAEEFNFPRILQDYCQDRYEVVKSSVMDAYMKTFSFKVSLAILDIGRFTSLHLEVIDKLLNEGAEKIIVHLTDENPEVIKSLSKKPGVVCFKKPVSLHQVIDVIESSLK